VTVDLAGSQAEFRHFCEAGGTAENNALNRALQIITLRRGVAIGDRTPEQREEAAQLVERMRLAAEKLVEKNWHLIEKAAAMLVQRDLTPVDIEVLVGAVDCEEGR
jgi:hypothetical protein